MSAFQLYRTSWFSQNLSSRALNVFKIGNETMLSGKLFHNSDGRNQIAIRFNRDLNRNEDSIQTLRDSIQVPCDLILIRFKF